MEELSYIKDQREKIGTKGKFQIGGIDNSSLPLMPHNLLDQFISQTSEKEVFAGQFDTSMESDQEITCKD